MKMSQYHGGHVLNASSFIFRTDQCVWHPKLFSDSDLRIPPQARFPDYLYENITRTFNVSQVIRMLGCEAPFTFQGHAKLKCTSGGMWKFRSNRHVSSLCSGKANINPYVDPNVFKNSPYSSMLVVFQHLPVLCSNPFRPWLKPRKDGF